MIGTNRKGAATSCTVEFDHGREEVPKALLRPLWEPFELLETRRSPIPMSGGSSVSAFASSTRIGTTWRSDYRTRGPILSFTRCRSLRRALEKSQPRLILADEVGLGKTIEAGLILKELRARMGSDLARVLIIVPASLVSQWQFELGRSSTSALS